MGLRINFELDEDDLKHFRLIMHQARATVASIPPEDIVAACEDLLDTAAVRETPGFIVERLQKLRLMIDMLSDIEWRLPNEDAKRVLNALAYFVEPEDLIPDDIPGLGFLDDAIMIELVMRELSHEIQAYQDFSDYRDRIKADPSHSGNVKRDDWLDDRRQTLQSRMRRRRGSLRQGQRSKTSPGLFD